MSRVIIPAITDLRGNPQEQVQDWVASFLVQGSGISIVYNDAGGTLTISSSVDLSAYATLAAVAAGYAPISHTHTAAQITDFAEAVDDEVATLLTGTAGDVTANYNDAANTLTIGLGSNVPRLNAASNVFTGTASFAGSTLTFGSLTLTSYSAVTLGVPSNIQIASNRTYGISSGVVGLANDIQYGRNATGPTAETRAAGGLRVCNADGSALGAVACGSVTSGVAGTSNGQIIVGAATSINARITIGGSANNVITGSSNGLGQSWTLLTDNTGSGGPAELRFGSTGFIGWGDTAANIGTIDAGLGRASANTVGLYTSAARSSFASLACANVTASGSIRPGQFTVATLPSAAANTGRTVQVTDSSVDFVGNIGATVAGGGSFNVDVKSNGTNWRITG